VVSHSDITALKLAEEALIEREHERDQLRHSLELAMEVQQNLLPKTTPQIKGLDIAAKSKYCDETGGDYYDFLEFNEPQGSRVSVVIADVSGHGIPSALLMVSARSALRQRSKLAGSISQILSDVNRQITKDVKDSGRFITLFYLTVDPTRKTLNWTRAGHEPALFYDQKKNTFKELKGNGAALGLSIKSSYEENIKTGLGKGNVIILFSDGIFEARDAAGQMFGKDAIKEIIRKHANLSAKEMLDSVFQEVIQFQGGNEFEDDATMAVIKIVEDL
jgi:sigma-B regulation protein RsbU (phosphoserine phosphatase)